MINVEKFDNITAKLVKSANMLGLKSFLLGTKTANNQVTVRFEALSMNDALQICLGSLQQTLAMELKNHPEYSFEYQNIFRDLSSDINGAVAKANQRVVEFKTANAKPAGSKSESKPGAGDRKPIKH